MTGDLFDSVAEAQPSREKIADGAVLLRGFVKPIESGLIESVRAIVAQSPFRRMTTPGGHLMSVAMTNCGERGWITDHTGYRYDPIDPRTGAPWPAMPLLFADLARRAAEQGGFERFAPDACLVNRYEPGTRLSLHQDLYGEHVFPLQVAILLSEPGRDFTGGEFVLTEQRPRMQSRAEVAPLRQGDGVIFPVHHRPVEGTRGVYRVNLRHGVSRLRSGRRHTLGIIFHDAE